MLFVPKSSPTILFISQVVFLVFALIISNLVKKGTLLAFFATKAALILFDAKKLTYICHTNLKQFTIRIIPLCKNI